MTEFYTVSPLPRPARLSEATRSFARDSLAHVWGLDTERTPGVELDGVPDFDKLPEIKKYDAAIKKIASDAPLRICPGEKISGAATLGIAIGHCVPARYGGHRLWSSVSHLTPDFASVLEKGLRGIREEVEKSMKKPHDARGKAFLESCVSTLDSFEIWNDRYISALEKTPGYGSNARNMRRVPLDPPRSFYEAVQSLWSAFAFLRLCGNWPGIGRIDVLLGKYLKNDLEKGVLTVEEAREILAHFFIKGCEWVKGGDYGSGDAQHYQNLVLSGIDADGKDVTNEVSYLVLDIIEELGISDFPTTVRVGDKTDPKFLRRVAEVMRYGGGVLAIYGENTVIRALVRAGYPEREARGFANDGCWETQIPGKTFFIYSPFDSLQILQKTLGVGEDPADFGDFESLYSAFIAGIRDHLEQLYNRKEKNFDKFGVPTKDWRWAQNPPCTAVSLFEQGCIEKGLSYLEGGPVYNVNSPHIGGLADSVNSLYAIKKLVYEEKKITLPELVKILGENWEQNEPLRRYAATKFTYYGNGGEEVDSLAARVLADFAAACNALDGRCPYRFPAGVSTFGRQLSWAPSRTATAFGRRAGEVLAANCSPTPGTDREGATAVIRSYCAADHTAFGTGSALDVKLLPTDVAGDDGLDALVGLIKGFVDLGGFFMQPDVQDPAVLRKAQENPGDFQTLSVRVSGWNARFVTLCREWQDMVIEQNEH
ncbi:MAG: hypothetical protein IJV00_03220 [Clostridia bacterium]|nr:hypothetical protein [Clostridia bacterium]